MIYSKTLSYIIGQFNITLKKYLILCLNVEIIFHDDFPVFFIFLCFVFERRKLFPLLFDRNFKSFPKFSNIQAIAFKWTGLFNALDSG